MRRSSNTADVGALEMPPRFVRSSPEEGRGVMIPIGDAGVHGVVNIVRAGAVASSERPLAEELPEASMRLSQAARFGSGTRWKRGWPQFHSMVSTGQCSGRLSTIRYASPVGARASRPSRKRNQTKDSRRGADLDV